MNAKKVSVCMAVYNGEKYIKEQLMSIIAQLPHVYDEIIISDDGSTDNTLDIIKEFNDSRIKIYNSKSKNVIYNFENAIKNATGEYIFLSDQDDIWYPNKISETIIQLENNIMVFSNLSIFKDDIKNSKTLYDENKKLEGFIRNFIKNNFVGATMAFKKELKKHILPFPKNISMHDVWIGLIAELYGTTKFIVKPLIFYRRHNNNISTTGSKSKNNMFKIVKMRFNLLSCIILRLIRDIF